MRSLLGLHRAMRNVKPQDILHAAAAAHAQRVEGRAEVCQHRCVCHAIDCCQCSPAAGNIPVCRLRGCGHPCLSCVAMVQPAEYACSLCRCRRGPRGSHKAPAWTPSAAGKGVHACCTHQQGSSRMRQLNVGEDSTCFVSALHMATCSSTAAHTLLRAADSRAEAGAPSAPLPQHRSGRGQTAGQAAC